MIIILATFVLEDPTTLWVGYQLSHGRVSWEFALSALALGIFLGDLGLYVLGRGIRRGLFRQRELRFRPTLFDLFLARFIPGLRTLTFTAAGFFEVPLLSFIKLGVVSALLWTLLLLSATRWVVAYLDSVPVWGWVLVGLALMGLSHLAQRWFTRFYAEKRATPP